MKTILALDGGGIRGAFSARILVELERRLGPLNQAFDLIAGTSTGGIIACGLAQGLSAQSLVDLYVNRGAEIFSRSAEWELKSGAGVLGPKYPAEPLERILLEVLGDGALSSLPHARLLVPTYATELPRAARLSDAPEAGSYFFKCWTGPNAFLRDVARCTSAAPTYFPPHRFTNAVGEEGVYTDGGTFANSPGLCAYAEARSLWPGEALQVVAIGTGMRQQDFPDAESAGLVDWARALPAIFMDGAADTVDYQLDRLLGPAYLRLDALLGDASPNMDDASPGNIARLIARAEALLAEPGTEARITALCDRHIAAVAGAPLA